MIEKLRYRDTTSGDRKPYNELQRVKTRRIVGVLGVAGAIGWLFALHAIVAPWPATAVVFVVSLPFAVTALVLAVAALLFVSELVMEASKRVDDAFFQ